MTRRSSGVARPEVNTLPSLPLPFHVRSTGHFILESGWSENVPGARKNFVQLFWCVAGEGEFMVDGKPCPFRPDEVIYHLPLEDHIHAVKSQRMEYRWLAFDGPLAAPIMLSYQYPRTSFHAGPCPHELFLELFRHLREMSPLSQRRMLATALAILALAGGRHDDTSKPGQIVARFIQLVQDKVSDESANINSLADAIGVHRSTLNRIFQERMKTSPKEYLLQYRLRHALSLLRDTDLPISRIATMSGIPYRSYFCNFIRKATGLSPSEYRRGSSFSA